MKKILTLGTRELFAKLVCHRLWPLLAEQSPKTCSKTELQVWLQIDPHRSAKYQPQCKEEKMRYNTRIQRKRPQHHRLYQPLCRHISSTMEHRFVVLRLLHLHQEPCLKRSFAFLQRNHQDKVSQDFFLSSTYVMTLSTVTQKISASRLSLKIPPLSNLMDTQ